MKEYFVGDRTDKFRAILLSWLGTPYKHRGHLKGRAADCTLFIGLCGIEMGIYDKIDYDYYPSDWHIHTKMEVVLDGIKANEKNLKNNLHFEDLGKIDTKQLKFGDWLLFSISPQGVSNHSGIYIGNGEFISALNNEGVCIKKLDESWSKHIKHTFRLYEKSDESGVVAIPLLFGVASAGGALLAGAALSSLWVSMAFIAGATIGSWLFPPGQKMSDMNMKPASLADFQMTQSNEGQPVPLTYGTVKIPANLIYYGNLVTEKQTEEVSGGGKSGGGGSSQEVTTGYKYFLDVWQAIAYGNVSIIKTYMNDKEIDINTLSSNITTNTGDGNTTPPISGLDYISPEKGVANMFLKKMYTGNINATNLPTISFVVRKTLPSTINHANMYDYGNNPAAIIYDILTEHCDIPSYKIDTTSFNSCADTFYSRNWGLNFSFTSQKQAKEMIPYILNFVDATLYTTDSGTLRMKMLDDDEAATYTIETDDFIDFSLSKPFWGELANDFRGAIVDSSQDYTLRIPLAVRNSASIEQQGEIRQAQVDLTAFQDRTVAFDRMYRTMKRQSFPKISVSIKVGRKYSMIMSGDVVHLINTDYNVDGTFRIVKKTDTEITNNEIEFDLLELKSFDDVFIEPESVPTPAEEELVPLTQTKIFELPYNPLTKYDPYYWILASKEKGFESQIAVYISTNGTDYSYLTTVPHYAISGTLQEDYSADTYAIDDTQGILFTPYLDYMRFADISRADLFLGARLAIIGDEVVAFQNYEPEGATDYRLTGVVRGAGYDKPQSHSAGDKIFIFHTKDFATQINRTDTFYLKLVPIGISTSGDIANATAIEVTPQMKALKPYPVARIKATRSGSNVDVLVYPVIKAEADGAGFMAPTAYTDEYPFVFDGTILYNEDNGTWINNGNNASFTINNANAFTLYVKERANTYESAVKSLDVGAADGEYIGSFE